MNQKKFSLALSILVLLSHVPKTLTSSKENHSFSNVSNFSLPEHRPSSPISPKLTPKQVCFAIKEVDENSLKNNHKQFPRISEIKENLMKQRNNLKPSN